MTEQDSTRVKLRVGIFVLAALILFAGFALTVGSKSRSRWFNDHFSLRTSFRSVEGLLVGAPVRLAGVTVGQVAGIGFGPTPGDNRVMVELSVNREFQEKIREDSVASISTIGVVGDKFVDITVGNKDRRALEPQAVVASVDPPDYNKILQQGDQIVASMSKLATAITEGRGLLHALAYDPRGEKMLADLAQSAADFRKATGKVARGEGTLGALLNDASLYEDVSNLVRGAERNWILRRVIRSSVKEGREDKSGK